MAAITPPRIPEPWYYRKWVVVFCLLFLSPLGLWLLWKSPVTRLSGRLIWTALLALSFAIVFMDGGIYGSTNMTVATPPSQTRAVQPAAQIAFSPQRFNGSSDTATRTFSLAPGIYIANMAHKGESNFAVKIYSDTGEYVDLVANTIGNFQGSQAFTIKKAGRYLLNITADGPWTVVVSSPS